MYPLVAVRVGEWVELWVELGVEPGVELGMELGSDLEVGTGLLVSSVVLPSPASGRQLGFALRARGVRMGWRSGCAWLEVGGRYLPRREECRCA